jgi:molecular chaperone GrpE
MKHRKEHETEPPVPEAQGDGAPSAGDIAAAQAGGGAGGGDGAAEPAVDEQRDRYLRLAAEYDNYRKRTDRERREASARGQAELVSKLIDALDDLARFAHIDPAATDPQTLHKGIDLVEQKMMKVLTGAGLEIIDPVDQTFDPQLHEAVTTEPALSPEDDHTVGRVFQRGYRYNGQLLRPARVTVKQWNG